MNFKATRIKTRVPDCLEKDSSSYYLSILGNVALLTSFLLSTREFIYHLKIHRI